MPYWDRAMLASNSTAPITLAAVIGAKPLWNIQIMAPLVHALRQSSNPRS